jgi:hypothetical protein
MPSTHHCVLDIRGYRLLRLLTTGFHTDSLEQAKKLLTGGARLENGPSDAREKMRILTGGSIAIMCPASHEGVPVKLFLHRLLLHI